MIHILFLFKIAIRILLVIFEFTLNNILMCLLMYIYLKLYNSDKS